MLTHAPQSSKERVGEREREWGGERGTVNWTETQNSCALDLRQAPADSSESGIGLPGQKRGSPGTTNTLHRRLYNTLYISWNFFALKLDNLFPIPS